MKQREGEHANRGHLSGQGTGGMRECPASPATGEWPDPQYDKAHIKSNPPFRFRALQKLPINHTTMFSVELLLVCPPPPFFGQRTEVVVFVFKRLHRSDGLAQYQDDVAVLREIVFIEKVKVDAR